jgi:hypothetical protein
VLRGARFFQGFLVLLDNMPDAWIWSYYVRRVFFFFFPLFLLVFVVVLDLFTFIYVFLSLVDSDALIVRGRSLFTLTSTVCLCTMSFTI